MENTYRLRAYYRAQAEAFVEHIAEGKRGGLSLRSYFDSEDFLTENDLLRGFFNDREALERIDKDRLPLFSDDKIAECSINGGYLNPSQLKAVKLALSNSITLIQGPPGTGKTEVILNILSCIRQLCPPGTSAAVLSTNNEALRNIHEKIDEEKDSNPKMALLYNSIIQLGSQSVRDKTFHQRPEFQNCFVSVTKGKYKTYYVNKDFTEHTPFFTSTIHSVKKLYSDPDVGAKKKYDYVIVDECSQAGVMLGLIAMSCGKRLILIGDVEQLAPVFNDNRAKELRQEYSDVNPLYMEEAEKSFLYVCKEIFGGLPDTDVMLTGHYRCHPSIIGFNNKYVYNNQLEPLTRTGTSRMLPANELAIRIVWYEGDYFEVHTKADQKRLHTNYRQFRIFFEEEMPRILEKLRHDPTYSVGIIAPYRSILTIIEEELNKASFRKDLGEVVLEGQQADSTDANNEQPFFVLTIHRSQGKGCNSIFFLSSEDSSYATRWPWSQQKRMLNVAVSRAKNELCVITSSIWLPEEFQNANANHTISVLEKDAPEEKKDNLLLCKLLDYVYNDCARLTCREEYGFHKSGITSIFDNIPYYRQLLRQIENNDNAPSAPELCMYEALKQRYSGKYDILNEVPLNRLSLECEPNELRIDFVICSNDRALVVIEVDGSYHRDSRVQEQYDEKKNDILSQHGGIRLVRVKTDGSEHTDIMEEIDAALAEALSSDEIIQINGKEYAMAMTINEAKVKKQELANELQNILRECHADFVEVYNQAKESDTDISVIFPCYQNPDAIANIRYDDEHTDKYYLCHFGAAYAFEYALMYELVLRDKLDCFNQYDYPIVKPSVLSLGCGSLIDLWGMKYAIAKITSLGLGVDEQGHSCFEIESYKGIDLSDWPVKITEGDFEQNDILNMFGIDKCISSNLIVFPKILNEIPEQVIDDLVQRIGETDFPEDEYYICFSHNHSGVIDYSYNNNNNGLFISNRIVSAIKEAAIKTSIRNKACSDYFFDGDIIGINRRSTILNELFEDSSSITDEIDVRYIKVDDFYSIGYYFKPTSDADSNRFCDFDKNFQISLENGVSLAQYFHRLNMEDKRIENVMNRTNNIVFQIVKLRRMRRS